MKDNQDTKRSPYNAYKSLKWDSSVREILEGDGAKKFIIQGPHHPSDSLFVVDDLKAFNDKAIASKPANTNTVPRQAPKGLLVKDSVRAIPRIIVADNMPRTSLLAAASIDLRIFITSGTFNSIIV